MERRDRIFMKIMANVDIGEDDACWPWKGRTSGNGRGGGYPRAEIDGQTVAVHRVLYTHFHGYIPSKKQVDHTCENRNCLNPDHLELVTHRQNQRRKSSRPAKDTAGLASLTKQQLDLVDWLDTSALTGTTCSSETETPSSTAVPADKS